MHVNVGRREGSNRPGHILELPWWLSFCLQINVTQFDIFLSPLDDDVPLIHGFSDDEPLVTA